MNFKRIALRIFFYFRTGYATYLSYPVALLSYATAIYYLAVTNIPILKQWFPQFHIFLIFASIGVFFSGGVIGWMHFKKILVSLYKAELDVQVESNPYSMEYLTPVTLPSSKILSQLAKIHGINTSEIDLLIKKTEEKFKLSGIKGESL